MTGFVAGRSRETARALLDLADSIGVDRTLVRATDGGYDVPTALADAYAAALTPAPEAPPAQVAAPRPRRPRKAQDKETP